MAWFATIQWARPWARRKRAPSDATKTQLAEELGREPTQLELTEKLGYPMS